MTSSLNCFFWLNKAVSSSFSYYEEGYCAAVSSHPGDPLWNSIWSVNIFIEFGSSKLVTVFWL